MTSRPVQNQCKTQHSSCKNPRKTLRIFRVKFRAKLSLLHQPAQNFHFSTTFYRFSLPLFHHLPFSGPPQYFSTIPQPLPLLQLNKLIERN